MNLYQKIVEIRKEAKGFTKDAKSYNYKYVTGNQILEKIRDKMNELNLLLIPSTKLGEHHTHEYITSKGKDALDFVVSGEMSYTWIDGDKPEDRLTMEWAYYGQQDDISKAYGSALTYSERYFLLKCLGLPTDEDDPDGKENTQGSKKTYTNSLSEGQINRLYAIAATKKIDKKTVDAQIKTRFNKEVTALTKLEYDTVCQGYEKMKVGE